MSYYCTVDDYFTSRCHIPHKRISEIQLNIPEIDNPINPKTLALVLGYDNKIPLFDDETNNVIKILNRDAASYLHWLSKDLIREYFHPIIEPIICKGKKEDFYEFCDFMLEFEHINLYMIMHDGIYLIVEIETRENIINDKWDAKNGSIYFSIIYMFGLNEIFGFVRITPDNKLTYHNNDDLFANHTADEILFMPLHETSKQPTPKDYEEVGKYYANHARQYIYNLKVCLH